MVGLCGVTAKTFLQPAAQRLELGHKTCSLALSRVTGSAEDSSARGQREPYLPSGHPHPQGSPVSRGQGQALPITLPIRTPFPARGWGRAMAPTFTAPVIAGGTDVQHGGGRSLCEVPPVRAGSVPYARAPLEKLQTVGSEVRHIPPGAKEGGVSSGKTAPAGLMGYISGQNRQLPQEAGA